MQPGEMTEKITFQEQTETSDGGGGYSGGWSNIASDPSPWAKITPVKGAEKLRAMQLDNSPEFEVVLYARTDLKPDMRIVWNGTNLNIVDLPLPLSSDQYMTILAKKEVE